MIAIVPQSIIVNVFKIKININTISGILYGLCIFPLFLMYKLEFKNYFELKYKFSWVKLFLGTILSIFVGNIINYFFPETQIDKILLQLFNSKDTILKFVQEYINVDNNWYLNTMIEIFCTVIITIIAIKYLLYSLIEFFFKFIYSYYQLLVIINSF